MKVFGYGRMHIDTASALARFFRLLREDIAETRGQPPEQRLAFLDSLADVYHGALLQHIRSHHDSERVLSLAGDDTDEMVRIEGVYLKHEAEHLRAKRRETCDSM